MRFFFTALTILLASPVSAGSHAFSSDGHTLLIYGDVDVNGRNAPIASITHATRRVGTLDVDRFDIHIDPQHRYQYVTDAGVGYRSGYSVEKEFIEISAAALTNPATHPGWRAPGAFIDYAIPVTTFTGIERQDGRIFIHVSTNPTRSRFLVTIFKVLKGVSP